MTFELAALASNGRKIPAMRSLACIKGGGKSPKRAHWLAPKGAESPRNEFAALASKGRTVHEMRSLACPPWTLLVTSNGATKITERSPCDFKWCSRAHIVLNLRVPLFCKPSMDPKHLSRQSVRNNNFAREMITTAPEPMFSTVF